MSKSILLSIRPQWVEKILNEQKTIEVRKQFPKDYVGWVYLYCSKATKSNERLLGNHKDNYRYHTTNDHIDFYSDYMLRNIVNGKVVARFYCDNVEEITIEKWSPSKEQDLLKASCLTENQLFDYCNLESGKPFYAIHISKLEIFDEPKELSEFYRKYDQHDYSPVYYMPITKAPQNYCYIEGEE